MNTVENARNATRAYADFRTHALSMPAYYMALGYAVANDDRRELQYARAAIARCKLEASEALTLAELQALTRYASIGSLQTFMRQHGGMDDARTLNRHGVYVYDPQWCRALFRRTRYGKAHAHK